MKKIKLLLFTLILFITLPVVEAKEINHFTIKTSDDNITIKETYNSSVVSVGQSINIDGTVKGINFALGNKINLNGQTDYPILAGNNITINSTTNNDAFILGNIITSEKQSIFKRDAIIAGEDIELNGMFNRNVTIYANRITLNNATINGNIKIYAENITVNKNAKVEGTLYYPEDSIYKAKDEAQINKTTKTEAIQTKNDDNYFNTLSSKIFSFLCLALIFGAISLFFPKAFDQINKKYETIELSEAVEVFTKGLVTLVLIPVVIALLCCTMIGIPLGVILLLLYAIALYTSSIFTAYLIGYKIWQNVFKHDSHIIFLGTLGLAVLLLLELIPGIRILVSIIATLTGLGLIFDIIKK